VVGIAITVGPAVEPPRYGERIRLEALLKYLPGPQPVSVRYGVTALLVLLAYGLRLAFGNFSGAYGFLFFILPVVGSALMFDRGTGLFAVALSGLLVSTLLNWDLKPGAHLGALLLFGIVGGCLVFISEGLHRALETSYAAEQSTTLLLDEMSHRVKNKFAMVSSIIALQARRATPEVRLALDDIARRVNVIATVHDYLQLSRHEGLIDMSVYLPRLCGSLKDAIFGPRQISLLANAVAVELAPDRALAVGVIVNELVTNAAKYAFNEDRPGYVRVDLSRTANELVLTVQDNGRGYSPTADPSLGSRLVTTFASQLGGTARWESGESNGCTATVVFPA
jgi:two-component system, sensor histidine kinase PdtaS